MFTAAVLTVLHAGLFAGYFGLPPDWRSALTPDPEAILRRGQLWRLLSGMFAIQGDRWGYAAGLLCFLPWFAYHWGRRDRASDCFLGYLTGSICLLAVWSVAALVWGWRPALGVPAAVSVTATICLLYGPRQRFALLPGWGVPTWIPVAGYFAAAFWGTRPHTVDFAAHFAGALFGLVFVQFDWRASACWARRRRPPPRTKPAAGAVLIADPLELASPAAPAADDFDQRIDELLAKITADGYQSLTEEELRLLMLASDRYRRRNQ